MIKWFENVMKWVENVLFRLGSDDETKRGKM